MKYDWLVILRINFCAGFHTETIQFWKGIYFFLLFFKDANEKVVQLIVIKINKIKQTTCNCNRR